MVLKKWMKKCQPLQLYITITLTLCYLSLQLVASYITHSLTLTIDSYLVLCNLIALLGCLITIKNEYEDNASCEESSMSNQNGESSDECAEKTNNTSNCSSQEINQSNSKERKRSEKILKNTFGWARIDVLTMLVVCVVFVSLCFSMLHEALQTLLHIAHHDEMHYPIPVFIVGAVGLVLTAVTYFLIGGTSATHSSLLHLTPTGVFVLDQVVTSSMEGKGGHRLNRKALGSTEEQRKSNFRIEIFRDVIGSVLVMICAGCVHFSDIRYAKYIDPIISIIASISLVIMSYPYIKESASILLQTIPDHIDIGSLHNDLLKEFPNILNVHDLHVWQLTSKKVICTAHIIFLNPQVYAKVTKSLANFFHEQGIEKVTIQPEFFTDSINNTELISSSSHSCLVKCNNPDCYQRFCCFTESLESVATEKETQNGVGTVYSDKQCCSAAHSDK